MHKPKQSLKAQGFTIVELLIVIVVIGILAAITFVAFNGVSGKAKEVVLKSDLKNASTQLQIAKVQDGTYPSDATSLKKSAGTNFTYISSSADNFCVAASNTALPGKSFYITNNDSIKEGDCSGGGGMATTMQTLTPTNCSSLATFTGSNTEAIVDLTDSRGGTTRTYQVAKLADGNCWMLNNLKLGSVSSTTTLTPADSNVASNFTLPQLVTSGSTSSDIKGAYGPVPGDTGTGDTNYGYLYNWPAATAGESTTSHDQNAGNAPNSICPANWRLPTGSATGEFAMLNAKMNNPSATSPSTSNGTGYYENWQYTGPFRGVLAGLWNSSFSSQGSFGYAWSSSAYPSNANFAFNAAFNASYVYPGSSVSSRSLGFGVRCLLN